MVAAVAAASVGVFVAVAAAWAAVAVAGCAAADSSSLQDSFSVITDGLYSRQRSVSDIWVDVIASTALGFFFWYLFLTLPNSSSWQSINIH